MNHFLHFIVNKQSRKSEKVFKELLVELPKHTQMYKTYQTENTDELNNLLSKMKKIVSEDDILVVVGGDGSLNHFITLYQKYNFHNYIAYIPSGSGNDFARTHQIPLNTKKAIKHLFQVKKRTSLSFIQAKENVNTHCAINSIGVGIDGFVNEIVNSKGSKNTLGPFAYLSAVFTAFIKQKKFPVVLKIDGGEYHFDKAQLVLVANNPYFGGGIKILPEADGRDNELDVLIANDVSIKHLFFIISRILTNRNHLSHPNLHHFKSKNVQIRIDSKQFGQKDGEVFHQETYDYYFNTKKLSFWI